MSDDDAKRPNDTSRRRKTPAHHGLAARLRNYFLTGLILVGPLYITVSLTWWFINWVDDAMRPFIPAGLRAETYLPFRVPGYGLIIALVALTLLGFLTAGLVGRTFVEFGENLLNRMPIVRPIYKTMKQIFETLFSKSGSSFRKVALAEFPAGMWSVVFLAPSPSRRDRGAAAGRRLCVVFHALHAQPDHGIFLLRAAVTTDRARHHSRAGDDADHVGRHRAADWRGAEEARCARREHARRPDPAGAAADRRLRPAGPSCSNQLA